MSCIIIGVGGWLNAILCELSSLLYLQDWPRHASLCLSSVLMSFFSFGHLFYPFYLGQVTCLINVFLPFFPFCNSYDQYSSYLVTFKYTLYILSFLHDPFPSFRCHKCPATKMGHQNKQVAFNWPQTLVSRIVLSLFIRAGVFLVRWCWDAFVLECVDMMVVNI